MGRLRYMPAQSSGLQGSQGVRHGSLPPIELKGTGLMLYWCVQEGLWRAERERLCRDKMALQRECRMLLERLQQLQSPVGGPLPRPCQPTAFTPDSACLAYPSTGTTHHQDDVLAPPLS